MLGSSKLRRKVLAVAGALVCGGVIAGVAGADSADVFLGAHTAYTRTHTWTIDKAAAQSEVTVEPGQSGSVSYTVTVTKTDVDGGWRIFDGPVVNSVQGTITDITVTADGGFTGAVSCPGGFPVSGPAQCSYSIFPPDGTNRTVTAVATLGDSSTVTKTATADFGNAVVTLAGPDCVTVDDTYGGGPQGDVICSSKTYDYSRPVGPYTDQECGDHMLGNSASIADAHGTVIGTKHATVTVHVVCHTTVATTLTTQVHDPLHRDITGSGVTVKTAVHDSSTVGGLVSGVTPTGSVTYRLYGNSGCTGAPISSETVAAGAESTPVTLAVGSYGYVAQYGGDSNYDGSAGVCEPFAIYSAPLTQGYWKNHMTSGTPTTAQYLPVSLGNYSVNSTAKATDVLNATNCGSSKDQDAVGCLTGQLLAAKLGLKNGSNPCAAIQAATANADSFLVGIGYTGPAAGYTLSSAQRSSAVSLAGTLDKFNNGKLCA